MRCLLCHKKISRFRIWKTKSEFCRDEHADTYKKQTLDRLLRDQEQLLQTSAAPPLPIADDPADDGLDAILAGGNDDEGVGRSHLLPAPEPADTGFGDPEPADTRFGDPGGVELSEAPRPESLSDILSGGEQQDGTPDDVHQQSAEEALDALRKLAEHSPAAPPDRIAPDIAGARDAAGDEPPGPLERLAASRNLDAQELLDEAVSNQAPETDPVGAGFAFSRSETVEKEQEPGGPPSMLERLMEAGPAEERSEALQMPPIGERFEPDEASSYGAGDTERDGGASDSAARSSRGPAQGAEARAADSAAAQPEADTPSIPVWLREFEAEPNTLQEPVARELADQQSHESEPDEVHFSGTDAPGQRPEGPAFDSSGAAPGSEEPAVRESQADPNAAGALQPAGGISGLLSGESESAHLGAADETPEAPGPVQPQADQEVPADVAAETARPEVESEPSGVDADRAAASAEAPAIAGEDHETLDSLLDVLVSAEDGGEPRGAVSDLEPGAADAAPPARNVVAFPVPDELPRFIAAGSQDFAESDEPAQGDSNSSLDPQQQLKPWLELAGVEFGALEPSEPYDREAADVIPPQSGPRFVLPAAAAVSHAGLSPSDVLRQVNASAPAEAGRTGDFGVPRIDPAQRENNPGASLGDGVSELIPLAGRFLETVRMIRFALRPSGQAPEGFLGHQADALTRAAGERAGLPAGGPPRAALNLKINPAAELIPAGSPWVDVEPGELALDQSEAAAILIGDAAVHRGRPTLRPISPWARLTPVERLLAVEPKEIESLPDRLLHQQVEAGAPILELQPPDGTAAQTPLKPIASSGRPEIFEGLWLPTPQLLDSAEQLADRMHGDLIRSKVECRLPVLTDIGYGLSVDGCHMPPNRILHCFSPAWADVPQKPEVSEVPDGSIEPRLAPRLPEAVYRRIRRGRATFPRVGSLLRAARTDDPKAPAMSWQPHADLVNLSAGLAHTDTPLPDFGGENRDWRAEPIGPLLALHGPENLDPCEYA